MNTYDPADDILYVHLPRDTGRNSTALETNCIRLPAGYADGSPLTSLRRRRLQPQEPAPRSAVLPFEETQKRQRK